VGTYEEFRANAAECQRMADTSRNDRERHIWKEMAEHWLWLIGEPKKPDGAIGTVGSSIAGQQKE
jgi:hypothetical protein